MRIFHKGLFLIALPLLFQLIFFVALIVALRDQEATVDSQIAVAERRLLSYKVFSECHSAVTLVTSDSIEPDPRVFAELKEIERRAFQIIEKVMAGQLSPKESAAFDALRREVKDYFALMKGSVRLHTRSVRLTNDEKLGFYALLDLRLKNLSATVEPIFHGQEQDARFIQERSAAVNSWKTWGIVGLLFSIILSAGVTLIFSHGFVKRIKHLKENSLRLARAEALLPSLEGKDEIAELDRVFHGVATAFSESYKRELAMFDNAADLIFCLNSKGEIERVNQILGDSLGYSPQSAIGSDIRGYLESRQINDIDQFLETVRESKGNRHEIEVSMISASGQTFEYQWSVRWEPSRKTFYCVSHDITNRKKLEKAKAEFVAMLSHDLRSPLTSLGATIEMVVEGVVQKMPDKCISVFSLAQKSVFRLVNLINELLDLEKLEAGEMEITPSSVAVKDLFQTAVDALHVSALERDLELTSIDKNLRVRADEERIVRVLINLLSNAIKYSNTGDVIRLTAEQIDSRFIELAVVDQGPGIPAHQLSTVFERYKQVRDAEQIYKQGSGLGLSICKAIVEAHGGTIGVRSTLGAGSTFWFRLPHEAE